MRKIDKLVPGGQGIATLDDGKKALLWNALPGEEVEFDITKDKRSYYEGIATKITKASPYRIEPKDECFLATSPWQIIDYDEELKQKQLLVQDYFRQQHITIDALNMRISNYLGYYNNNHIHLGLRFMTPSQMLQRY